MHLYSNCNSATSAPQFQLTPKMHHHMHTCSKWWTMPLMFNSLGVECKHKPHYKPFIRLLLELMAKQGISSSFLGTLNTCLKRQDSVKVHNADVGNPSCTCMSKGANILETINFTCSLNVKLRIRTMFSISNVGTMLYIMSARLIANTNC